VLKLDPWFKTGLRVLQVDADDTFFYCGTTSGDILKINLKTKLLTNFGPAKDKFKQGITDIKVLFHKQELSWLNRLRFFHTSLVKTRAVSRTSQSHQSRAEVQENYGRTNF